MFRYLIPTKIVFGSYVLDKLHKEKLPGRKALIVISSGNSANRSGALSRLQEQLNINGISHCIYNKVTANPAKGEVMEGVDYFHREKCDFIIALGGGSCIDAAKAIAIVAANGGDLWDYFHGGTAKAQPVKKTMVPLVAIPTTAGTGSEADQWMVISDKEKHEKIGFGYSKSFPVLAVVDPTLMTGIPSLLTAYQGIDALFHATEGYLTRTPNPISDALAEKAIALIHENLPMAVKNGRDLNARESMAVASTISGMILATVSMTGEHALGEGLSGFYPDLPHGVGLLMISLEYYREVFKMGHSEDRLMTMAKLLGEQNPKSGEAFIEALKKLYVKCGVDSIKMKDYGIRKADFEAIVELAMENASSEFAAEKQPLTKSQCIKILENSYK